MKKLSFVFLFMLVNTLVCKSQISSIYGGSIYTGTGRLYTYYAPTSDFYIAHVVTCFENVNQDLKFADRLTLYFNYTNNNPTIEQYTSSHGDYLSFKIEAGIDQNGTSSNEQFVLYTSSWGMLSFVIEDNRLCVVDLKTDKILTVLGEGFSTQSLNILVSRQSYRYAPTIYVMNNGYINQYVLVSASSVNSVTSDGKTSSKAYDLNGVEVAPAAERVFVQDGKVRMNINR